jgi:hypothetical protein
MDGAADKYAGPDDSHFGSKPAKPRRHERISVNGIGAA